MVDAMGRMSVRKRDGRVVEFDAQRIVQAIRAAFNSELGQQDGQAPSAEMEKLVRESADRVLDAVRKAGASGEALHVEHIQDIVEISLMQAGCYNVARRYILYRQERARVRTLTGDGTHARGPGQGIAVLDAGGNRRPLDIHALKRTIYSACAGLKHCSPEELIADTVASLFDGATESQVTLAAILSARTRIESEPEYGRVATRLLLKTLYREVFGIPEDTGVEATMIERGLAPYVHAGIDAGLLDPRLAEFDLELLARAIRSDRDETFTYLGLQTLADRYLIRHDQQLLELPQYLWMRVAMGLALHEGAGRNERAMEFYEVLSTYRFVSATPTLFNSGTVHPQLSSCYLSTVRDDLGHIFKVIGDNAALSKWAGGLGNDWTNIRAANAFIRGTNGRSQGVIPFLKIVNDTALAVNQGGKRKGAVCAYLEIWHLEIEDFIELRKNTGDERRRTHDMHTAAWIPDLFMKRVENNGDWTLLSPDEAPDLHGLYGPEFEARYAHYENLAARGLLRQHKTVPAVKLWRHLLSHLFETGHPWITFKDPSNIRSAQDHVGRVHGSNLCTEILLNTSPEETAVCNLGSINLAEHLGRDGLDLHQLESTVRTAMRMLDNVIDINFYPTPEARRSNLQHRPVGLGIMGFQDMLFKLRISYADPQAVDLADRSMEAISFFAILASTELAKERGVYTSYRGSKWDRGLLPIDTIELLAAARGGDLDMDRSTTMPWEQVREAVRQNGMRNCQILAIAPTATISNIAGCTQSIEPQYRNLFTKSNLSGEFTIVNEYLIDDLKALDLWDTGMLDEIKYHDGSIVAIDRIPADIRSLYRTAFEIEPRWIMEAASRRQKWIDMGQSLNLYIDRPSGAALHDMYVLAWRKGLKTTYYLRGQAATQIEKSSLDINRHGIQPRWMKSRSASAEVAIGRSAALSEPVLATATATPACRVDNPDCEACQ